MIVTPRALKRRLGTPQRRGCRVTRLSGFEHFCENRLVTLRSAGLFRFQRSDLFLTLKRPGKRILLRPEKHRSPLRDMTIPGDYRKITVRGSLHGFVQRLRGSEAGKPGVEH